MTGGLVDSARLPETEFLEALGALLESDSAITRLAARISDPRLDHGRFQLLLRRELLDLYRWAAGRLLRATQGASTGIAPSLVVSLLPHVAPATHALRRAVPFAAIGLRTSCCFADDVRAYGAAVVVELARALRLEERLELEGACCASAVAMVPADALVVVTGRTRTVDAVRTATPARVVAATGRCSLVVARTHAQASELLGVLRSIDVIGSCTQARAAFVSDLSGECRGIHAGSRRTYRLDEIARRCHPSVVLVLDEADSREVSELAGYCVLPCAADGSTGTSTGFGADPVYGWPGDYLV